MGLGPNLVREFFDISETGVRLVVKSPLKKGDEVEVLIKPGSGAQPIKRLADIIFAAARPDGAYAVGLRFSKMLTFAEVQSLAKPGKNLG